MLFIRRIRKWLGARSHDDYKIAPCGSSKILFVLVMLLAAPMTAEANG